MTGPHLWHVSCPDAAVQASQAIVVGNAVQEVKAWAHHAHHAKAVYVAEQHIAAGVLEGLQALGFMQAQLAN